MASERERMVAGELYRPTDPELVALRRNARRLTRLYNATREDEAERRREILRELFGAVGPNAEIEPAFRCDYGFNIRAGDGLYMNFDCVVLDVCPVTIGSGVLIAPGVHIYTATHPEDPAKRLSGVELGKPVAIGSRVWIGGGAVICPGVTIGDDAVIGAGSVVVKDIPAGVVAVGNPARVVRPVRYDEPRPRA